MMNPQFDPSMPYKVFEFDNPWSWEIQQNGIVVLTGNRYTPLPPEVIEHQNRATLLGSSKANYWGADSSNIVKEEPCSPESQP